ncbi:MAG: lyase family protein [Kineosporiaceae bacterium]
MTDLLAPGDDRADGLVDDGAVLAAAVGVEQAWLDVLVDAGIAPAAARADLGGLVGPPDVPALARAAEGGGNPVLPLVVLLRERLGDGDPARWLHRGLTSQDVLDTALVGCLRAAGRRVLSDIDRQVLALVRLAEEHRGSVQAARTLARHAVPTTFAAVAAGWLHGVLDAAEDLRHGLDRLPAQVGGAAGTLAAPDLLARTVGLDGRVLVARLTDRLGLPPAPPWHTRRRPFTRVGDAFTACTDAWGKIAEDVVLRTRPEVGELTEPPAPGRGASSAMPHKANPVLATLIRSRALAAPQHAATVHLAAALAADERPAGAWHAEWPALRALARGAVVAGSLTAELLAGLVVHPDRMRATAAAAAADLLAERRAAEALTGVTGDGPDLDDTVGMAGDLVDEAVARAAAWLAPPTEGGRP